MTESKEESSEHKKVRSAKEIFNLTVGEGVSIYTPQRYVILGKITAVGEDGNVITVEKTICTYHPRDKSWYRCEEGQEYRVFLSFGPHDFLDRICPVM